MIGNSDGMVTAGVGSGVGVAVGAAGHGVSPQAICKVVAKGHMLPPHDGSVVTIRSEVRVPTPFPESHSWEQSDHTE